MNTDENALEFEAHVKKLMVSPFNTELDLTDPNSPKPVPNPNFVTIAFAVGDNEGDYNSMPPTAAMGFITLPKEDIEKLHVKRGDYITLKISNQGRRAYP